MAPRVMDVVFKDFITASPSDNLARLRNLLLRHGGEGVLIVEDGRLAGVVTLTDLLMVYTHPDYSRRPLDTIPVREVMVSDVTTVGEGDSLEQVARLMVKKNTGFIPVVDEEGNVTGIVTRESVLEALLRKSRVRDTRVAEVMDRDPPVVSPFHTIYHVAEVMESKPYAKAIVVDNQVPVGVIARSDIVFINPPYRPQDSPFIKRDSLLPKGRTGGIRIYLIPVAQEIMTPNPITISISETVASAAEMLVKKRIGILPVVDDRGRLEGAVAHYNILAYFAGLTPHG